MPLLVPTQMVLWLSLYKQRTKLLPILAESSGSWWKVLKYIHQNGSIRWWFRTTENRQHPEYCIPPNYWIIRFLPGNGWNNKTGYTLHESWRTQLWWGAGSYFSGSHSLETQINLKMNGIMHWLTPLKGLRHFENNLISIDQPLRKNILFFTVRLGGACLALRN